MSDYYQEKIQEIKELMKTDIHKAFAETSKEMSMPYIPEKYEPEIISMHKELLIQIQGELNNKSYSLDEILEMFWSNEETKEAVAIENLKNLNLRTVKEEIKKWIEEKPVDRNISKAYLYELLVSQEVDIDITIDKTTVNPIKNGSMFDDEQIKIGFETLQELSSNEPALEKVLLEEFERYMLISFPNKPTNGSELAKQIYNIVKQMFDETIILTDEEKVLAEVLNK